MTEPLPLGPEETCPYVSVILPVRNEQASIHSCLSAVLEQDYPSTRMEVIVADGMSTDGTRDIVRSLQSTYANLCCIDNPGRIVATGLNAAIRLSKGHIVVRVDGHSIIEPDYVRSCVAELDRSGADNVGGRMCASGGSRFGRVVAVATSTAFGVGGRDSTTPIRKSGSIPSIWVPGGGKCSRGWGSLTKSWCAIRTMNSTTACASTRERSCSARVSDQCTPCGGIHACCGGSTSSTDSGKFA
ncbi:MAG: glycosyltransferase [bacterium]|nr:glycosyltransferase [bacterium]